jgi:acetylornithine deacetylase/succinyl-diaminopimelate desuccinylase-like protein
VVPNAAWRLVWALSTLKDREERVLIPGFYDDVREPTPQDMAAVARMPAEEENLRRSLELDGFLGGLQGEEHRRRHLFAPTCTICGIVSGYTGPGSKTVLPAEARAKVDFRLVPNQHPQDVLAKLKAHLAAQGFSDVEIASAEGVPPSRTPLDAPFVRLVVDAARTVYGKEPVVIPTVAGSGPMHSIGEGLGIPVAATGVGHPESRIHAPNENIRLEEFRLGILHAAEIMERFGDG